MCLPRCRRPAPHQARGCGAPQDYAGGEYSLFYANCAKATVVSFDIRVALYNVRPGGVRDYLSVGEDMLPVVYMVRARNPTGSARYRPGNALLSSRANWGCTQPHALSASGPAGCGVRNRAGGHPAA